jgi:hypothetical protein
MEGEWTQIVHLNSLQKEHHKSNKNLKTMTCIMNTQVPK